MILTPDSYQRSLDFISDKAPRIQFIARKFINLLGINHFVLTHVDHTKKNTIASLQINMVASTYWVEHGMPLPLILPTGFYLVSQFKTLFPEHILNTLREKYSTDHTLFYVQQNRESTDIFSMAADPENKLILNNYINHSSTILKFLLYFKQETKKLLEEAKNYTFEYDFSLKPQKKAFPHEIPLENYNGFSSLYDVTDVLSRREFECLELINKSTSLKFIAKKLNLSPRTVESYLINVKNKLKCNTTSEVLDLYNTLLEKNKVII